MFTRIRAWIEAAAPLPLRGVVRIADALGDRPGVDVAIVDQPAFLTVISGPAAGEGGHTPLKRRREQRAISYRLGSECSKATADRGSPDRAPLGIALMMIWRKAIHRKAMGRGSTPCCRELDSDIVAGWAVNFRNGD
jgi:hypothetical protein